MCTLTTKLPIGLSHWFHYNVLTQRSTQTHFTTDIPRKTFHQTKLSLNQRRLCPGRSGVMKSKFREQCKSSRSQGETRAWMRTTNCGPLNSVLPWQKHLESFKLKGAFITIKNVNENILSNKNYRYCFKKFGNTIYEHARAHIQTLKTMLHVDKNSQW